jgi:hypothetical protein
VVEPVTPIEGATGVAYEEVAGLVIFFDGSVDEGFLQTDESSEYKINSQIIKYKSRSSHTWTRAFSSLAASEVFWLTECQPQMMYRSWQPERGIGKLQIGAQKQTLPQLNPEDFGVYDVKRVQLSPDLRVHVVCA